MTENSPNNPGTVDPSMRSGAVLDGTETSQQRMQELATTNQELVARYPEFMGMTVYGSVARGEAEPDSDADLFVFLQPDGTAPAQQNSNISADQKIVQDASGSLLFHHAIGINYALGIEKMLLANGLPAVDTTIVPIDEPIIDHTTTTLLETAKRFDDGDKDLAAFVPQNIRGLFHVPVAESPQLDQFRTRVLDSLKASQNGQTAWRMIRHSVIAFEKGRVQQHYDSLAHRHIPLELDEVS